MAKKKRKTVRRGRRPGRPSALGRASTSELENELARRQDQAADLAARRDALLADIDALDVEIAELGGTSSRRGRPAKRKPTRRKTTSSRGRAPAKKTARKKTGRKRPRNTSNLVDALHKTLRGKTMSVTEVAEAVQKHGYKTTSPNFRVIVNQALINRKNKGKFKKVARGQYTAK